MIAETWTAGNGAAAGLQADEPAACRGHADRAAGIRCVGDCDDTGCDGRSRTAGRTACRAGGIERIATDGPAHRLACKREANFRAGGKAKQAETGLPEARRQIGIGRRIEHPVEEPRAGTNGQALERATEILGKRRHAGKAPDGKSGGIVPEFAVERSGIRRAQRFVEMTDRAKRLVGPGG